MQIRTLLLSPLSLQGSIEAVAYIGVVTLLATSSCAYLLSRLGYLSRIRSYRRTPRAVLDSMYDEVNPSLTIIVPSYREEPRVIRQTLLSAALQEYPDLRLVLLIDDPPNPIDPADGERLDQARGLVQEVTGLLAEMGERLSSRLEQFEQAFLRNAAADPQALLDCAATYDEAAAWLRDYATRHGMVDHTDEFLVEDVVLALASDLEKVADALRQAQAVGGEVSMARLRQLYRRLTWIFSVQISCFERKQFASLSHEPNKAENLNSYIGLMGGRYRVAGTPSGDVLLPVQGEDFVLEVPEPDYVLTLDADSMLLPEYCLRLVAFMEQPENVDVAVAQTPYSAYRGAPSRIERIAGATTDLQHMVHLGLTHYGATFWVGANAVLRKAALDDIVVEENQGGFTVRRYIQHRTPVEDTESSIDLRLAGWRLINIPERLSYSATPADFGALCIQRERWANGGLVILPNLIKLAVRQPERNRLNVLEAYLRLNYLGSIAWTSLGLSILLFYPFNQQLLSSLAVLTAVPYFAAIANDLHRAGYRRRDVAWLYGFNMLVLPINLVGTLKSIGQAIGGQKVAFARTPKVQSRTVAPLAFIVIPFVIVDWSCITLFNDILAGRYLHAAFAGLNAFCTLYAALVLYGIRYAVFDVLVNVRDWVFRPVALEAKPVPVADWVTVLYHGASVPGEASDVAAASGALAAIDQEQADGRAILLKPRHGRLAILGGKQSDTDEDEESSGHGITDITPQPFQPGEDGDNSDPPSPTTLPRAMGRG